MAKIKRIEHPVSVLSLEVRLGSVPLFQLTRHLDGWGERSLPPGSRILVPGAVRDWLQIFICHRDSVGGTEFPAALEDELRLMLENILDEGDFRFHPSGYGLWEIKVEE